MLRNMLLSLAFHLAVVVVGDLLYASSNATFSLLFVAAASFTGYILFAYKLLRPTQSSALNLLSVAPASLIGCALGIYFWADSGPMGFHWMIFLAYNMHAYAFSHIFHFSSKPEGTFWFFPIPTLLLWAGLQLRAHDKLIRRWTEKLSA